MRPYYYNYIFISNRRPTRFSTESLKVMTFNTFYVRDIFIITIVEERSKRVYKMSST